MRIAHRCKTGLSLESASQLGDQPVEIMQRLALLRCTGATVLRIGSLDSAKDSADAAVPVLLNALSTLERQQTTKRTSDAVYDAKARGGSFGRPRVMTPARKAIAARMLAQGKRGPKVLAVIRRIEGPSISQSAYYLWQKAWIERQG